MPRESGLNCFGWSSVSPFLIASISFPWPLLPLPPAMKPFAFCLHPSRRFHSRGLGCRCHRQWYLSLSVCILPLFIYNFFLSLIHKTGYLSWAYLYNHSPNAAKSAQLAGRPNLHTQSYNAINSLDSFRTHPCVPFLVFLSRPHPPSTLPSTFPQSKCYSSPSLAERYVPSHFSSFSQWGLNSFLCNFEILKRLVASRSTKQYLKYYSYYYVFRTDIETISIKTETHITLFMCDKNYHI